MHSNSIVHRDIKPENILIEDIKTLTIKITDFGFATYFNEVDQLSEVLGSPLYMPPEIIQNKKYTSAVDVWSAGVVVYIMLSGKPPFFGTTKDEVYTAIKEKALEFPKKDWEFVSEDAKDFLRLALDKEQYTRATTSQLLAHPFLQERVSEVARQGFQSEDQLNTISTNLINFAVLSNF